MRLSLVLRLVPLALGFLPVGKAGEPLWAYGYTRPPEKGEHATPQPLPTRNLRPNEDANEQTRLRQANGSEAHYSLVDVRDLAHVIDWFPGDHPPMTELMRHGPAGAGEQARGCASCHLPNGKGRPENAPVSGLPAAYFVQQLQDFKADRRTSADARKPNTFTMVALAKTMTDAEMHEAAAYFASIKWTAWVRVVETESVPKTRIVGNLFLPLEEGGREPIAGRIIEMPEDEAQSEQLRNPHSGFVAYVPVGSLKQGEQLVKHGDVVGSKGKTLRTVACASCHGPDLLGVNDVPGIAGRSPSYLARQLYDFQQGTRHGVLAQTMQPVVAHLTEDDMVDIAAYVASLPP